MNDWPARRCVGDCHQGRKECTTPDACELPDVESMQHYEDMRILAICLAIAIVACAVVAVFA